MVPCELLAQRLQGGRPSCLQAHPGSHMTGFSGGIRGLWIKPEMCRSSRDVLTSSPLKASRVPSPSSTSVDGDAAAATVTVM